jgi:hypothetical protein
LPVPRDRIVLPRHIRSTLIASSFRAVRERGREDDYRKLLDPEWKDLPERAIPGVWLPFEAGLVHYRACDGLSLTVSEQLEIGRDVGARIHGTFLGTMIRAAKNVGVTPWLALAQTGKLYTHLFDGGAVCVMKAGPKDARMELVGNPCVGIPYFRNAVRGLWQVAMEFFCQKAYVNEAARTSTSYKARISWA